MQPSLSDIATYLDAYLGSARFPQDQNGIYHPTQHLIQRIGVALEPWPDIVMWVKRERLDALFLHLLFFRQTAKSHETGAFLAFLELMVYN